MLALALKDDAEWAAQQTKCLRKGVAAAFYEVTEDVVIVHDRACNGPFHRITCKNIVGGCGCCHAEVRSILLSITRKHLTNEWTFGTTFSPCLACATAILAVWPRILRVVYLHPTEHDLRGVELLKEAGIPCDQVQ